jgi:hypothetical protein
LFVVRTNYVTAPRHVKAPRTGATLGALARRGRVALERTRETKRCLLLAAERMSS